MAPWVSGGRPHWNRADDKTPVARSVSTIGSDQARILELFNERGA
jgi:hypothetical protein